MDYSRIRGMESGQRLAFEELICQLAHLDRPAADAEFRRIEGAGETVGSRPTGCSKTHAKSATRRNTI